MNQTILAAERLQAQAGACVVITNLAMAELEGCDHIAVTDMTVGVWCVLKDKGYRLEAIGRHVIVRGPAAATTGDLESEQNATEVI